MKGTSSNNNFPKKHKSRFGTRPSGVFCLNLSALNAFAMIFQRKHRAARRFGVRLVLLLLLLLPAAAGAQTVIELKKGGTVRGKTIDDYRADDTYALRAAKDSVQYVDHLRRAFNALHADSLAEAERLFKDALRLRPDAPGNHIIRYNLGLVDMARGENAKAVERLTDIIKDYPLYFDARLVRAEANLQLGRAAEAVTDAQYVLDATPADGVADDMQDRARFIRGAARYQLRLYPDAHADFQTLLAAQPGNESAQLLDALTLQRMGQNREALNRLNLIVEAHPESVDALSTRAEVEMALEKPALARADYDRLVELYPEESSYRVERARALIALGEKQAARRDLDTAVRLGVPRGMVHALYMAAK